MDKLLKPRRGKMTTVVLSPELEGKVLEFAHAHEISKSAAIRYMVNRFLHVNYQKTTVNSKKLKA